jgi:nifR3 family TIM-barrel protein
MQNIWTKKNNKPLLVLAPMAGYTDSAFRQLCHEFGADIVVSELISADAIAYTKFKIQNLKFKNNEEYTVLEGKNNATAEMLMFSQKERPFVVQLFGKYPEKFAKASKWISEELKPDGIDINMGCPARKVVGSDHGAALLKNPDLAVEIVKAVKENTQLPVSVKTRLGWDSDDQILDFAPRLVEAGIDAITIHGRTYKDGFKGVARWENIYQTKFKIQNLKFKKEVAVIGNGDISSYEEAMERANNGVTKLDGVAIGRAVFGKPWIFQKIKNQKSKIKIKELVIRHAELAFETKGERGIIEMRKHLLAYTKGLPNAKELRRELVEVKSVKEIEEIINRFEL